MIWDFQCWCMPVVSMRVRTPRLSEVFFCAVSNKDLPLTVFCTSKQSSATIDDDDDDDDDVESFFRKASLRMVSVEPIDGLIWCLKLGEQLRKATKSYLPACSLTLFW